MKTIEHVLEAAGEAAAGVCEDVLLIPIIWSPELPNALVPQQLVSVTLLNDQVAIQVGIVASWETYTYIVRIMLNLSPRQYIDERDVTDGIAEMVNMVAGQVKTRLNGKFQALKIGFPTIQTENRGSFQPRSIETASKYLSIGVHDAQIAVMMRSEQAKPATALR